MSDERRDDRDIVLADGRRGRVSGRWQATAFDLLVVTYATASALEAAAVLGAPVDASFGLLVLWGVLVLVEGVTGGSPGKLVAGLEARDLDGNLVRLRGALLRRPWGLPLLLTLAPATAARLVGVAVAAVVLVAMAVTTSRDPDGRGLHDRLAGSVVRGATTHDAARTITVVVIVGTIVVSTFVRATMGTSTIA